MIWLPPSFSRRAVRLAGRNFLVWRKLIFASIAANLVDPIIFLLGFGLGIGSLVGDINEGSYLQFLAAGMLCYGTMNGSSFEALYSAFTRMHVQRTWEGILNAPMTLDDVLLGEWLWATIKGTIAGGVIWLVLSVLGLTNLWMLPLVLVLLVLVALTFAGMGLAFNALASGYDFFAYYFTLFLTPMMMLSGAFFPVEILPNFLQTVSTILPLSHAVALMRPLLSGEVPDNLLLSFSVLIAYTVLGVYSATVLTRHRLIK